MTLDHRGNATVATAVRPFTVEFLQSELDDLLTRVLDARLPDLRAGGPMPAQGVQLTTIRELMRLLGRNLRLPSGWRRG